jgi:hypothetical protein
MKAQHVISLLQGRHSKDVFFVEAQVDHGTRRMDAWVLIPSYTKSLTIGYEVKVSRSDFLQDKKMQDYLPYCNQMYLVAPKGVILEGELPEGFGYILATENRLMTKVKAPVREVEIPESFYRGLLCNRMKNEDMRMTEADRELEKRVKGFSEFSEYVAGKKELKDIGFLVSHKLATDLDRFEREKRIFSSRLESFNEEVQNWEQFKIASKEQFGDFINQVIKYGKVDLGIDKLNDIFIQYNHPEREVLGIISEVEESFKRLKTLLGGNNAG